MMALAILLAQWLSGVSPIFAACVRTPALTETKFVEHVLPTTLEYSPQYPMGQLQAKDVIKIRLDFPWAQSGSQVQRFSLRLIYSTNGASVEPMPYPFTRNIDILDTFYETFWTVPTTGEYTLRVESSNPTMGTRLFWYYLTIWNANSDTAILRRRDVLRAFYNLYFLVKIDGPDTEVILSHSRGIRWITFYRMSSSTPYTFQSAISGSSRTATVRSYLVPAGDYIASFRIDLDTTISYQTDPITFTCPYNSAYPSQSP